MWYKRTCFQYRSSKLLQLEIRLEWSWGDRTYWATRPLSFQVQCYREPQKRLETGKRTTELQKRRLYQTMQFFSRCRRLSKTLKYFCRKRSSWSSSLSRHSTSVSQSWRSTINDEASLFRTIDLTKLSEHSINKKTRVSWMTRIYMCELSSWWRRCVTERDQRNKWTPREIEGKTKRDSRFGRRTLGYSQLDVHLCELLCCASWSRRPKQLESSGVRFELRWWPRFLGCRMEHQLVWRW